MYSSNSLSHLPALGDSTDIPSAAAAMQLGQLGFHAPLPLKKLVSSVDWEWFREVASRIARQYRRLHVGEGEWLRDIPAQPLMIDESASLTQLAGAHAWLMALAQQAGMEIRDTELEVLGTAASQRGFFEIAGVATLAGASNPRGTGRRLNAALSALAADMLTRCHIEDPAASIQFFHRKALQIKSPVDPNVAMPMAAYVVRFAGISPEAVAAALKDSLTAVSEALGHEMRESVLVINPAMH